MNSVLPLLFSAWWTNQPYGLSGQNFGINIPEHIFPHNDYNAFVRSYLPQNLNWGSLTNFYKGQPGFSSITANKDNYVITLNVQQFKQEELSIKIINRFIIVEAKHEEKHDNISTNHFLRRYLLSDQVDFDKISSNISTDGILTITAPFKSATEFRHEKTIHIEQTGEPALKEEKVENTTESNAETITTKPPK